MGSIANDDHPLRLFLFDSPRTSCHAFYKLFSQHPQIDWGRSYHDFSSAALYGPERMQPRLKHGEASEKAQLRWGSDFPDSNWWTYELSVKALLEKVEASEKTGKIFFGKEHLVCLFQQDILLDAIHRDNKSTPIHIKANPTHIPDDLMKTLQPIFVIRHPILMVSSQYRGLLPVTGVHPLDEDFECFGTLRWTQIMYDYFVSIGIKPIIVEAVDFIYNTKATTDKLCGMLGLDPEGVKDTWDPVPKEYWPDHSVAVAFTGDLMSSSGIERRHKEAPELTINLDTETGKWSEKYGDEIAQLLRKRVEAEMPIFEYLQALKLRS